MSEFNSDLVSYRVYAGIEEMLDWTYMEYANTLSETRLDITLLNADKIPAKTGISISLTPKTSSGWTSAS